MTSAGGRVLVAIFGVAVAARLVAAFLAPPVHADQVFQYLEPAWQRLHGLGYDTWEWHDGIRSWALAGYHGGLIALLELFGVTEGRTLQKAMAVHWALAGVLLVWAASRGARCFARGFGDVPGSEVRVERASLIGAALIATFPLLVSFAPQTLSENPSMIALVWGLVFTAEAVPLGGAAATRRAAWAGACLSLGVCLRIASGPLAVVPLIWLLSRRRFREAIALGAGALVPLLLFGLLDLLTWGTFLSSFWGYLKFNLIEGRAAEFGVEPWYFYVERMHARLPLVSAALVVVALWSARRTWPILASFACGLGYLSLTPHKEERFGVILWVYLLLAAAIGLEDLLDRTRRPRAAALGFVAGLAVVIAVGHVRLRIRDFDQSHAVRDAQAWVGKAPDATGLLLDDPYVSGGYMAFSSSLPMTVITPELLSNPLYNYVITKKGSKGAELSLAQGFSRVHTIGSRWILKRPAAAH
jgi:phosphatidylinositol glycan class B